MSTTKAASSKTATKTEAPDYKRGQKLRTPQGTARFAKLDKPDTEGKYADGKYKVDIIFDRDDPFVKQLEEAINNVAMAKWGKVPKNLQSGDEVSGLLFPENMKTNDKNKKYVDEMIEKGQVVLRAKSKFQPAFYDSKRNPLPKGTYPKGGDTIKMFGTVFATEAGKNTFVSFQLEAVQVLERRAPNRLEADEMFDEEEGYEADPSDVSSESDDEAAANSGDPNADF